MLGLANTNALATLYEHHPAGTTAAVITRPATAGVTHVLDWVAWSLLVGALGGTGTVDLTVSIAGVTVYDVTIDKVAGTQSSDVIEFPGGLYGAAGAAMVVTLSDPGHASNIAAINASIR